MVYSIEDKYGLREEKNKLEKVFECNTLFPDRVFSNDYNIFIAFDFDLFFWDFFLHKMSNYVKNIDDEDYTYFVIDPSPEKYFYKHYKIYGIGKITVNESLGGIRSFLNRKLTNEANKFIDDLTESTETFALFSNKPIWGLFASRSWEIGIVGFKDEKTKNIFLDSFGEESYVFTSLSERIQDLDDMLHFSDKAKDLYGKLLKSYS